MRTVRSCWRILTWRMAALATDARRGRAWLLVIALMAGEGAAVAAPSFALDAYSDARRRGLSWSEGKPALEASAVLTQGALALAASAMTTRGSARHGGADAALEARAWLTHPIGLFELSGGGNLYLFPGASGQGFGELGVRAALPVGPLRVDASLLYAPPQEALGGSLLYMAVDATVGFPGTPFTVQAGVGRSSGRTDDIAKAARLRPESRYVDARLGVTMVSGPVRLGARLTTTDISGGASHAGTRLALSAGLDF